MMDDKAIAKLELKDSGKYFQTLEGHTIDALKILKAYIQRNREVVRQFCKRWEIDEEKFLRNLFLTVYFHDIGKLTKEFQANIRQNKRSQRYPHAYYGFFLLRESFLDGIIEIPVELAAILGHHTQLYDQIYGDENQFEKPTYLKEEIKEFVDNTGIAYKELGFSEFFDFAGFGVTIPEFRWGKIGNARKKFVKEIKRYIEDNKNWERTKSIFSYFFAILQTCDDYASAYFSNYIMEEYKGEERIFDGVLKKPEGYVPLLEVDNPVKSVLGNKEPYKFQRDLLDAPKFVALFAPCGRGKTEGALLWGLSTLEKYKRNKIVFAMPTQTTSNAMYDRLRRIRNFGEENVGLYHGRSFVKLKDEKKKEKEDFEEEKEIEEIRSETFKGNILFKPITITTIDHLLYAFVKGFSQADFALGNLQNAVIIFDEVHYYEKLTLEHLLTLFKILVTMDIPHLLMSGTLPDFMLRELDNQYKHVIDEEGLEFSPFKLELRKESAFNEDVIKEIADGYKKGLTQFAILNTVERVKQFYLRLKEELKNFEEPNLMLYHSQFTYSDRVKKEEEIYRRIKNKPFLLVATQVIEVSLDISCDVMYSELAPSDAMGQRAGRLNREGREWRNEIVHALKIYTPENHIPYDESLMNKVKLIVRDYERPMGYSEIKELCDEVYADYKLEIPNPEYNLWSLFGKSTVFGDNWKEITFDGEEGRMFRVRDDKFQHVDVIPECIYEIEGENALRVENMAKIPLYLLLKDMKEELGHFYFQEVQKGRRTKVYRICRYPYSYEIGFDYGAGDEVMIL